MAKTNKASSFGSRKGITGNSVRSDRIKTKSQPDTWYSDVENFINEAVAMPSAAVIVTTYYNEHGKLVRDPAGLNDSIRSLKTIIENHLAAVKAQREALEVIKTDYAGSRRMSNQLSIRLLDVSINIQDIMNDFANIGMFAIDNALDYFRAVALEFDHVESPAYMTPRSPEQVAMVERFNAGVAKDSDLVILDVPEEPATPDTNIDSDVSDAVVVEEKKDE